MNKQQTETKPLHTSKMLENPVKREKTQNNLDHQEQASIKTSTTITAIQLQKLTNPNYLPQPWQKVISRAKFKKSVEDFQVDEMMNVELTGTGEHLWLLVRKTNMNTAYVAQQLAKWADIPLKDVGYSGLKDRQAVTTQWFSLRIPKKQLPDTEFSVYQSKNKKNQEALEILQQTWHGKKLNRGTHRANHFSITLRDIIINTKSDNSQNLSEKAKLALADDQKSLVAAQLQTIANQGVPNYFGSQRFGISGNNVIQALEWFEQGTINGRKPHPKRSRDIQSLLLSSARSAIFNQILSERVKNNSWNTGLDGEVFNLDGSGSVFASEKLDEALRQRLASGDIHPTAPLWGIKNDKVTGKVKQLEYEVVNNNPILQKLALGLEDKQIKTMRRPLRLFVSEFDWQWTDEQTLVLKFSLPTGTFATSVLASFVDDLDS